MIFDPRSMAGYRRYDCPAGSGFRFFCDLSGALVYTSKAMKITDEAQAVRLLWEQEVKQEFNQCSQCGRWVSDMMFNADVLKCVDCAPWENRPRFCSKCGNPVFGEGRFCRYCGEKLRYGP